MMYNNSNASAVSEIDYESTQKNGFVKVFDLSKSSECKTIMDLIKQITFQSNLCDNPFFVADLDEIYLRHADWLKYLPRVEPFYAVKSNHDTMLLKLLAYLGAGFDCSSKCEIERVLDCGVHPDRITYANPSKQASFIKYSGDVGVKKIVFDNEYELLKIRENHPAADCILRIKVRSLPAKFGADFETSKQLIAKSIELNMNLVGICFYVGFRQKNADSIVESIRNARCLFDYALEKHGLRMSILDIGGGFPGTWQTKSTFIAMCESINACLAKYFPQDYFDKLLENSRYERFRIIGEPGTYYSCSAYTLCVCIISKKALLVENNYRADDKTAIESNNTDSKFPICSLETRKPTFVDGCTLTVANDIAVAAAAASLDSPSKAARDYKINQSKSFMYFINDTIHGSFKWYDLNEGLPIFLKSKSKSSSDVTTTISTTSSIVLTSEDTSGTSGMIMFYKTSLAGTSCDSCDFIVKDCLMPEMDIGDYLVFKNMGSYTKTCAVNFNGIPLPRTIYASSNLWHLIREAYASNLECVEDYQNAYCINTLRIS